jgi:Arc/MetJ-type ribon-helix-helix transcriptional regulator
MVEKKYGFIGAKITPKMKDDIAKAIDQGEFLNESDLIRQAIRKVLDKTKEA